MKAIVKNFRGIAEGQIDIAPIALLCGHNGAGKTSMARAIAAAASGVAVPFDKVTKKDCKMLLRHGTYSGSVSLGSEEGSSEINWPDASASSIGRPPYASEIATGLTDLLSMKSDKALAYLINLLKAEPTLSDLKSALQKADIGDNVADQVWKVIEGQGWEAAHKRAVEKGQQMKGAWQQVTGEAFGSKKMQEWKPADWSDDLLNETAESIAAKISEAQATLEKAIGLSAGNRAIRDEYQRMADELPEIDKKVAEQNEVVADLQKKFDDVETKLKETPNPSANVEYACPHCEKPVNISAVSGSEFLLTKAAAIDEKKLKELRSEHALLCGEQQNLKGRLDVAKKALNDLLTNKRVADDAKLRFAEMGDTPEVTDDNQIEPLRIKVNQLLKQSAMMLKMAETTKIVAQMTVNQALIVALCETGVRKEKLVNCMEMFASQFIQPLCIDFGIPPIAIDTDLNIDVGDTSYQMLSESEQYRVRTILQLAIAKLEQASVIIIDRADILDKMGRSRLMRMLVNAGIPAVICMTINDVKQAPDLSKMGAGNSYWIENGVCTPFSQMSVAV